MFQLYFMIQLRHSLQKKFWCTRRGNENSEECLSGWSAQCRNNEEQLLLCCLLRGPFAQKMTKLSNIFFAFNEVSTCRGRCREILQLCDVCNRGSEEFQCNYNPSIHKEWECLQKNRSPEKFNFATSKECNSHSF